MEDKNLQEVAQIDEMRRRGRRRLIGAVVLALCAVIFVPMLLEKEPAPLGDNVEVTIPSQNRTLPVTTPPAPPASTPAETPAVQPAPPPVETPPARRETPPAPPAPAAVTERPPTAAPSTPPAVKPPAAAKPPEPAPVTGLPPAVAPGKGTFSVQLAAFTDDKGANTLVNKLKRAGYPAYVEPSDTSRGMVWRVRVGAYKTRDVAMTVRERLRKEGHDSMVTPAR